MVIGLDCASPDLMLTRWAQHLPHLSALRKTGLAGPLRSCHPPITIPAWMVMGSGVDAGQHGVYGFRTPPPGAAPGQLGLTQRNSFHGKPLWETLGNHGLRSTIMGVPGTWPPTAIEGKLVPGILTPQDAPRTWPEDLMGRLDALTGGYQFDVQDFRNLDLGDLVQEVTQMPQRRFDAAEALAADDDWNLFWMVEIGLDRLHHALWHTIDPTHPRYDPDHEHAGALLQYYKLLDQRIGRLIAQCDQDEDTAFIIVSDHGARPMLGGVRVNQWLLERGHLVLHKPAPETPTRLRADMVNWDKTRAWAMGGYCGRLFMHGTPDEALLQEILEGLRALPDAQGKAMNTLTFRSQDLFTQCRGTPPDGWIYFGDLGWRAIDSVGGTGLYSQANDTGPDAANHDWDGVLMASGAGIQVRHSPVCDASILHISPWIRHLLGVQATS